MSKITLATVCVSRASRDIFDLASMVEESHAEVWYTLAQLQVLAARFVDYIEEARRDTVGSAARHPRLVYDLCLQLGHHGDTLVYRDAWLARTPTEIEREVERVSVLRSQLSAATFPSAHFDAAIAVLRKQDALFQSVRRGLQDTVQCLEGVLVSLGCQLSSTPFELVVPPPPTDIRSRVPSAFAYDGLKDLAGVVGGTRVCYGSLPVRVQPLFGPYGKTRVVTGRTSRSAGGNAPIVPGDTPPAAETNEQVPEEKTPPRGEPR